MNNTQAGSNYARKETVTYFSSLINDQNFFGIGYLIPITNNPFYTHFKGLYGYIILQI